MSSRLPLSERLDARMKRPKELAAWSLTNDKANMYFDDRSLRYYYSPQPDLERQSVDLSVGFETSGIDPLAPGDPYMDIVLKAIMKVEEENNQKIDASIITWRGLMTQLLVLSQGNKNRRLLEDSTELDIVGFDGQIFMCQGSEAVKRSFSGNDTALQNQAKFMYTGYNFEHMATLPRPWGECNRDEIEGRYRDVPKLADRDEYNVLVKSGVGKVSVVYGAEVDCVEGGKNPNDKLKHYVELKTSSEIRYPGQARNFESKLLKTWLQSFLSGVPKIAYGFRDRDFKLLTVEEYRTEKIPAYVKNSLVTEPGQRWNGNDVIGFYAILVQWLKDRVQDGETYKLVFEPNRTDLVLKKADVSVPGRRIGFLSDEFVAWRESLRQKQTEDSGDQTSKN